MNVPQYILAFLIALILMVQAHAAEIKPIVIDGDHGGVLSEALKWYHRLYEAGVPVRVEGMCISACTSIFMLPKEQWCMTDKATMGFHGVALLGKEGIEVNYTKAWVYRAYPSALRLWFFKNINPKGDNDPKILTTDELVEMGVARKCND